AMTSGTDSMTTRRTVTAILAALMMVLLGACTSKHEAVDAHSIPQPSDSPVNANEHESGPESPIAYGMSVPRGATQVGPIVRMRSQKLIDAYQPELDEIGRASCREREKRGEHAV